MPVMVRKGNLARVFCPGCDDLHVFDTDPEVGWTVTGPDDSPTVTPSLLVTDGIGGNVCHSYIIAGEFQFLGDCTHALALRIVPLPELPEWAV